MEKSYHVITYNVTKLKNLLNLAFETSSLVHYKHRHKKSMTYVYIRMQMDHLSIQYIGTYHINKQ